MGGIDDADPNRLFSIFGYWSVNQRNILGIPFNSVDDDERDDDVDIFLWCWRKNGLVVIVLLLMLSGDTDEDT